MRLTRHVVLAALLSFGSIGLPARAQVEGGGGDNVAVAINTRDGATVFRLAFKIARVVGDVVDQGNAAVAFANCEACRTVAVAIQTVLVFSEPSIVTPENLAIALNYECTACETMAFAYQFVLGTGGPVHFTAEGNQAIAEIRRRLQDLRTADFTADELQAQLDEIAGQLEEVIATALVPAGPKEDPVAPQETAQPGTDPSPTPLQSPAPTVTPESSPTPEATTSPTPLPSPS